MEIHENHILFFFFCEDENRYMDVISVLEKALKLKLTYHDWEAIFMFIISYIEYK
jgi:hypothetical protein